MKSKKFFISIIALLALLFCALCACEKQCEHDIVVDQGYSATCMRQGKTDGSHCKTCGEVIVAQEPIPIQTHDMMEWTIVRQDTYLEDGLKELDCPFCRKHESRVIPKGTTSFTVVFAESDERMGRIIGTKEQTILNGKTTEEVTAEAFKGYSFVKWSNGLTDETIRVTVEKDETVYAVFKPFVPSVFINTSGKVIARDDYTDCFISVEADDERDVLTREEASIIGQDDATWERLKKPYVFRFDGDVDFLGMGKGKTWILLADYLDPSLCRNDFSYAVGKALGLSTTSDAERVLLYLNAEKKGLYLVCEMPESAAEKVGVSTETNVTDTGYLVTVRKNKIGESKEGALSAGNCFAVGETLYDVVSSSGVSDDQLSFIESKVQSAMSAAKSGDYERIKSVIDVDSFAKTYILYELFKPLWTNPSSHAEFGGSFYLYKTKGGKLFAGPAFDFDVSSGNNKYETKINDPTCMYVRETNPWFNALLKCDGFASLVGQYLTQYKTAILAALDKKTEEVFALEEDFLNNNNVWYTIGVYVEPNPKNLVQIETWDGQVNFLVNWLKASLDALCVQYVK